MLEVRDLRIRYGMLEAVNGVSFVVNPGQILGIFGNNGAGKTSTVNAIMGLVRGSGSLLWQGQPIGHLSSHARRRIGIVTVPEGRHIFSRMTIQENLEVAFLSAGQPKSHFKARLQSIFDMFPVLAERRHDLAGPLSGGQAQMLAVSRGLIGEPSLLMVDELSLGLAPAVVKDILANLQRLVRETKLALIISEQKVDAAMKVADVCAVLERGTVIHAGTRESLMNSDVLKRSYLGAGALTAHQSDYPTRPH